MNGATGATGATGSVGTNGANGATGATGPSGQNGTNGLNGATGATGATGSAGTNGINGATGATGPSGQDGTNGLNGATGATGATGSAGTNGINGATGATGATGLAGTNGVNGATGATGSAGTNGVNGATGATGSAGTNGINGVTGATGPSGQNGTNGLNGATGATGATGSAGINGANGATGVTGPTGATGVTGASGSVNAWGLTGNTGTTPATNFIGTIDAQDFVTKTNSIEQMRVTSGGSVGIGTTLPGMKLDVVSTTDTANDAAIRGTNTGLTKQTYGVEGISNSNAGNASGVYGLATSATANTNGVYGEVLSNSSSAAGVYGQGDGPGSMGVVGWSLASTGNGVGVFGTALSPNGISVKGQMFVNGGISVEGISTVAGAANNIAAYFQAQNGAQNYAILVPSGGGSVGIGTSTPTALLHVLGTGYLNELFQSSSTVGNWISMNNTTAGSQWFHIIATGSSNGEGAGKLLFTGGALQGQVNKYFMVFNDTTGYVGINNSNPTANLDVVGTTLIRGTNSNSPAAQVAAVEFMTGRTSAGSMVPGQSNADLAFQYGNGGFRHFIQTRHMNAANDNRNSIDFYLNNSGTSTASSAPGTGNIEMMSITAAGVGIGTNAPVGEIHVNVDSTQFYVPNWPHANTIVSGVFQSKSYYNGPQLRFTTNNNGSGPRFYDIGMNNRLGFVVEENDVAVITIDSLKRMGVNKLFPSYSLDVTGMTRTDSFTMTQGATAGYIMQSDAAGNGTWVNPATLIAANSVNIYNSDGTLTGNRTVTMGANNLTFSSGAGNLYFNTTNGVNAGGGGNVAMGNSVTATGGTSVAFGTGNSATGVASFSTGWLNNATGTLAVAFGQQSTAGGYGSMAVNGGGSAGGAWSMAVNVQNSAGGNNSFAAGNNNSAPSYSEAVFGTFATTYTPSSATAYAATDRVFNVGIGQSSGSPADGFTILKNGKIGIGTSSPITLLANTATNIIGSDAIGVNTGSFTWSFNNGGYAMGLYNAASTGGANGLAIKGAGTASTNKLLDISTGASQTGTGTAIMTVLGNGRVGIGNNNPVYPLEVDGGATYNYNNYGYVTNNSTTPAGWSSTSGNQSFSIYATGRIAATEFDAYSDNRIKKDRINSNAEKSLQTLMRLQPVEFKYIDEVEHGGDNKMGFIAQEVMNDFPQAVQTSTGFVPSVYQMSKSISFNAANGQLQVTTEKPHGFKVGDKIKLLTQNNRNAVATVAAVNNDNTFTVGEWTEPGINSVFVYGKEVNDFHTVDYDRIYTLNVSATQQLAMQLFAAQNRLSKLEIENEHMKTENERLKTQGTEQQQMMNNMKAQIDIINQRLNTTGSK